MRIEHFLRDYWQKRPLLIRGAFPGFTSPISPDELAGLACEDGALSRLIVHNATTDAWHVQTGPLPEDVFGSLPERDWTLLVQDVDKWDADVAELLMHFDFIPRWRIDDIMVSFAAPEGSVGAHVDQYDVFLIQGMGHRRWQIDAGPNPPQAFRDNVELKLLREFSPTHDWVLAPGDILYLPPGVPHHGVAEDPCLTLSVGMRAPSHAELMVDLADTLAERLPEDRRYADPDLTEAARDGRIDADALHRARRAIADLQTIDDDTLATWFGGFITRYRSAGQISPPPRPPSPAQIEKRLLAGSTLHMHPMARCAWHASAHRATLHIDGDCFDTSPALARHLNQRITIDDSAYANCDAADRSVVHELVKRGILSLSS
ncbi:cupin domain-containing protein [Xanthomonadaceae bacterium XH05]|nr:cupin domain-containing protein [Xanthomonadaceae bacterium XH05]